MAATLAGYDMTLQKNAGAVRRFIRLARFGAWLQNLPNKIVPPPFRLMQIGSAFWQSRALYVAVRLDIAGALADAELSIETLAERVAADADALYRLLRMLVAMGVFEEAADKRFKNNKLSSYLRLDHPNSVRAMVLMHNSPEMGRPWFEQLEQGVRNGGVPFELAHGQAFYDYLDANPEFDALFAQAMDSVEAWPATALLPISTGRASSASSTSAAPRAQNLSRSSNAIRGSRHWWPTANKSFAARRSFGKTRARAPLCNA